MELEELLKRKAKAESMPSELEKHRYAYDKICADIKELEDGFTVEDMIAGINAFVGLVTAGVAKLTSGKVKFGDDVEYIAEKLRTGKGKGMMLRLTALYKEANNLKWIGEPCNEPLPEEFEQKTLEGCDQLE